MREAEVIARLRRIATAPEARGLLDDVAVLDGLVITHDSIAEGVHFLSTDPPASVGWKLVAVNLSDLAAKGATPRGALLSLTIAGDGDWEERFLERGGSGVRNLCAAADRWRHDRASRRRAARAGDDGDRPRRARTPPTAPAAGPATGCGSSGRSATPRQDWRSCGRPRRRSARWSTSIAGRCRCSPPGSCWRPHARAMMDVSDGLLLDARRLAEASGCGVEIDLDALPLSDAFMPSSRRRTARRGCSRRPAATITPCSPRFPPSSIRQAFLYQPGPGSRASGLVAGDPSIAARQRRALRQAAGELGFEHRAITRPLPLRQWLIGLSGLISGMALALLIR